jgi:retron-type reverse transcriptase
LAAWKEFQKGKRQKKDVEIFETQLEDNVFDLQHDLASGRYKHGGYMPFTIADPKPRDIHKASVRDRLVHHAVYRVLYLYIDKKFIYDSYSCRIDKGTHKAIARFKDFARSVSRNNTKTCWVLKCDIRKFFASIDHVVLKNILAKHTADTRVLALLDNIIDSFSTEGKSGVGLPLGNLTSQLLVNIYMNEFDQYVKHVLKEKYYIRYADDFVFLSRDKKHLENLIPILSEYLENTLKLSLHPDKVYKKTFASGVDFLGWVHFPTHRVLRGATKRRMLKKLAQDPSKETVVSYKGMLSHGNGYKLSIQSNL